MKFRAPKLQHVLAVVIAGWFAAGPVLADKPPWAGGGKGDKKEHRDKEREKERKERHGEGRGHFEEQHYVIVREFYGEQFRHGRCPPGLAKKRNGCMPPGQAKKWQFGQPLPPDVVYYPVPQPLVVQIGVAPPGYRYVRVASDILLIAIGTGLVVDAIQDLGRM